MRIALLSPVLLAGTLVLQSVSQYGLTGLGSDRRRGIMGFTVRKNCVPICQLCDVEHIINFFCPLSLICNIGMVSAVAVKGSDYRGYFTWN